MYEEKDRWSKLLDHEQQSLHLGGLDIIVDRGVFTPSTELTYTTAIILENLPCVQGKRVADVGTGSGVVAIRLALNGVKEVVATDLSDLALINAAKNIKTYNVENIIKLQKTNLLDSVEGSFDFIFANLPILDSVWSSELDPENTVLNFIENLKGKLNVGGRVYIPWGSFAENGRKRLERALESNNYKFEVTSKDVLNYTWCLYTISSTD